VVVTIWGIVSAFVSEMVVPSPLDVIRAYLSTVGTQMELGAVTAVEAAGGLTLATIVSFLIVAGVALVPKSKFVCYPFITLVKASPAVVFVPLFIAFVGSGPACKILVSAMICFFPIVIGGIDGALRVPERFNVLTATYGASRMSTLSHITWAYSLSGFLTGLKTAAPLSVVGAIVGEYVAGGRPTGIGNFVMEHMVRMQMTAVFMAMLTATLLGLTFLGAMLLVSHLVERRVMLDK